MSEKKFGGAKDEAEAWKLCDDICVTANYEETNIKRYNEWAENYEHDCDMMFGDYEYITEAGKAVRTALGDKKDAKILDVAAGTGLVGRAMKKEGFTNIDYLDGSPGMLEQAEKKNVYHGKKYIAFIGPKPTEIPADTYDLSITTGTFHDGHLKPDCLDEMLRVTKKGGYVVLGMGEKVTDYAHLADLLDVMKKHCDDGHWKFVRQVIHPAYLNPKGVEKGWLFTYRKL